MDLLTNLFSDAQQWLFEALVQPMVFGLGFGGWVAEAFTATGWLLVGLLQLLVLVAVLGPLQRWRPVEAVLDRKAVQVDIIYTLLHRLGLFRLILFFTIDPLMDGLFGEMRVAGVGTVHLDAWVPGITDQPLLSFALYLVAFDFLGYWVHRGQHQFEWWWSLHSLHHSQRQMTLWSDNRNHLLDSLLGDIIIAVAAQLVGVAPGQFIAIVAFTQLSESLQHANLRVWFGRVGERLWVSPRFHRLHHSIGLGHESAGKNTLGGHNFGVLLPWWDMLFGTANFALRYDPTGIRDQLTEEGGRNYGQGFWQQQWLGMRRLWAAWR
jgi:sterol desaturase/sphingolipid hydroxylase (fatty acid hydroxylase superfamily)